MGEFSHFDQHGNAVMVDVTKKKETTRTAIAQGKIKVNDEIFEKVWNEKVYEANNTVMVHIRHLREKLGEVMGHKELIKTVWGVGYKVEE